MSRESPLIKFSILALGLLFLLCTLFLVVKLGNQLYWQHIGGNLAITEGFIEQINLVKAQPVGMGTGKVRPSDRWWLEVKYSYIVDGKRYRSDKLNASDSGGGQEFISLANDYEKARRDKTQITVYYYKLNPSKAVLIPGVGSSTAHFIAVIVFGLMAGATLLSYKVFYGKN